MSYSENAMCAILLCSNLGINKGNSLKPLSLKEWNIFFRENDRDKRKSVGCFFK